MKTRKRNKKSGFSLLELLAVVTILGIIAAVIVPRVTASSVNARQSVQDHHIALINASIEQYNFDEGGLPPNLAALTPAYLPDGIPANPVDPFTAYALDGNSRCFVP